MEDERPDLQSLASLLQDRREETPLQRWAEDERTVDFQDRLALNYSLPEPLRSVSRLPSSSASSRPPTLGSSDSSYMPGRSSRRRSSRASPPLLPPDLGSDHGSIAESSVNTQFANDLLLPLSTGRGGIDGSGPIFKCAFWFLGCSFATEDEAHWRTHSLSHFRGITPPKAVQCPLCRDFQRQYDNGDEAWEARMDHVSEHHRRGQTLSESLPDYNLFHWLWQKRILTNSQYQDLRGNYDMSKSPQHYGVGGNSTREERVRRQPYTYFSQRS